MSMNDNFAYVKKYGFLVGITLFLGMSLVAQKVNRVDDNGLKQGPWRKFYEGTTAVFYKGQFKDDMPVGAFTYYYAKGRVKGEMDHRAKAVYNRTYHPNGKLMAQGKYVGQKKDSVWAYYTKSGLLSSMEQWDKGAKHGIEEVYYPDGQISESTTHEDGLRNGQWKQFYENGQQKVKGTFVQDEFHGPIEYHHVNGTKEVTGKYNEGVRTGTWMYFNTDGSVRYQAVYRGGKIQKERFENGTFNTYGVDNVIISTVTYKNGRKEGVFMEYHDDAEFKLVPFIDQKTGETYQKEVKTGNEIKRKGSYVNNLLEGDVTYYNALGRQVKKEHYTNGELQ